MARIDYPVISTIEAKRGERLHHHLVGIMQGRINAVLEVTLDTSVTQTVVNHPLIQTQSAILLNPTNSVAAALGIPWPSSQAAGTVTLEHATSAGTETYRMLVIG